MLPYSSIELYVNNQGYLDPNLIDPKDAAAIVRMWNEWFDRHQKEAKESIKQKHKIEIADAADQYEL
jgi:hypothetical protein